MFEPRFETCCGRKANDATVANSGCGLTRAVTYHIRHLAGREHTCPRGKCILCATTAQVSGGWGDATPDQVVLAMVKVILLVIVILVLQHALVISILDFQAADAGYQTFDLSDNWGALKTHAAIISPVPPPEVTYLY